MRGVAARRRLVPLVALCCAGCRSSAEVGPVRAEGAAVADENDVESRRFSGQLISRYRGRWRGGDDDQDLLEVLSLDARGAGADPWRAHLLGRVTLDMDGEGGEEFASLADSDGDELEAELYELYADFPGGETVARVRVGRQQDAGPPELAWFDGVALESAPRGERELRLTAYAGVPVHLYEGETDGDRLAGIALDARPWAGARGRLDYLHLEDERVLGADQDDLLGARLHQVVDERWTLEGEVTALEGDLRDARGAATWLGDDGLFLRLAHYELLDAQRQRSLEADPFFDSLRALFPYRTTSASVARSFGDVDVELGGDSRRMDDPGDEGAYNREYDRGYLELSFPEALPGDVTAAVSAERWDAPGDDVHGLGAELSRETGEREELSVGTYRSLYKLDLFGVEERVDVRTWYVRWRRRGRAARNGAGDALGLHFGYEYEDGDGEDYHSLRAGLTWHF